jgi:tetratricopeptide (TPR) repeat protein
MSIRSVTGYSSLERLRSLEIRHWILVGISGLLIVLALQPLWDAAVVNMAGVLVNRAVVAKAATTETGAQSDPLDATAWADDKSDLERAMNIMETAALTGPRGASREISIWRTYGAAASLAPSDHAFDLLLRARNAGRLDRVGELWLGEVASATQHWEEAAEAYRRVDASNVLIGRAETYLQDGENNLAIRQYLLAKVSLDAAVARETAEQLLRNRSGNGQSASGGLVQSAAGRVTLLYRIGRGLLAAGQPLQAVPVLEQALENAAVDSPGAMVERSLNLSLALALTHTLPDPPNEKTASVETIAHIRALVDKGIESDLTAAVCVQAARILLQTGDVPQAVLLLQQAVRLDPHFPGGYLALGSWRESRGMTNLARETYQEGAESLPADPEIAVAYALASYRTLPAYLALPALEKASEMETNDPSLFVYLGDCYTDLGRTTEARAAYKEGLRRAPGAKPLLDRLDAIGVPEEI